MITKKEFYFIRHGQTDYNLLGKKVDHTDVSLNACGREQAQRIEPLVATWNIHHICLSPFKRAKETKDIVSSRLTAKEWIMPHLGECSLHIWQEMTSLGPKAIFSTNESLQKFMNQVLIGINEALSKEGQVLIVSHGGVYWVLCCLMNVEHEWMIDNCVPVHFSYNNGKWIGRKFG